MADSLYPGQICRLTIQSLAFGGDGVGRYNGLPLFVPDTAPGDQVDVRITAVQSRFGRAEVVRVVVPAPDRIAPLCPYFGTCGGCQWQHLSTAAQLQAKTEIVRETLQHLGRFPDPPVRPCGPSPEVWGYRHKADFTMAPAEAGFVVGFHARDPRRILDVAACPLLPAPLNQLLQGFRELLQEWNVPAYDPGRGSGLVRGIRLRQAAGTGEATAWLVTGRREFPHKRAFVARWQERCPGLVGVFHTARTRASQSPTGRPVGEMLGRPLEEQIQDLRFQISPRSFFQVNPGLIPRLWETVQAGLALTGRETVWDAYSGVGTLALPLARRARQVVGIEQNASAVRDARANARRNKLRNFTVLQESTETALPRLAAAGQKCDALVLDPPRRGCAPAVLQAALALKPERIVYVSCDPATLARDLQFLTAGGYTLQSLQPLDFFPQTYHVECVATLVDSAKR
jgi:23S rRNA (uracil1939-C5)-methyltransferase